MAGDIWRVGDGQSIDIWIDPWIQQSPMRKVITRRGDQLLTKVVDLVNPISYSWDEQFIRQTFWKVDTDRILSILLSSYGMSDFVSWRFTQTGLFTVRSAYHVEWERQYGLRLIGDNELGGSNTNVIWDTVWNLFCQAKVEIFLRKTMHGALPCRSTLANRRVRYHHNVPHVTCVLKLLNLSRSNAPKKKKFGTFGGW